jgi:hypothetical protein
MAENNNRQEEFKNKLFALLREYNVEMEVHEHNNGYSSIADGISFYSYSVWDESYNQIHPAIDFKVGNYENGKS